MIGLNLEILLPFVICSSSAIAQLSSNRQTVVEAWNIPDHQVQSRLMIDVVQNVTRLVSICISTLEVMYIRVLSCAGVASSDLR
jgi:hypothetical protein